MIDIKSKDNSRFKQWMALQRTTNGRDNESVLVEGLRFAHDVLLSGWMPLQAIMSESAWQQSAVQAFRQQLPPQVEQYRISAGLMRRLSPTQPTQGVILVVPAPPLDAANVNPDPHGLYLIADQVQDPGNLGSMIRTADAFGFAALLLTVGTVSPLNDKVLRASMGSVFHLPLYRFDDLNAANHWLKRVKIPLLAADLVGESSLSGNWQAPAALVIGNEARGLSAQAMSLADHLIHIPMPGQAESLNAAAAAAVLCYELMRRRDDPRSQQEDET